jgi:hypothetical protein
MSVRIFPRRKTGDTASGGEAVQTRRRLPLSITMASIEPFVTLPQKEAAQKLGISLTALKKTCRKLGVERWSQVRKRCKAPMSCSPQYLLQKPVALDLVPEDCCHPTTFGVNVNHAHELAELDRHGTDRNNTALPFQSQGSSHPSQGHLDRSIDAYLDALALEHFSTTLVHLDSKPDLNCEITSNRRTHERESEEEFNYHRPPPTQDDLGFLTLQLPCRACPVVNNLQVASDKCWLEWYEDAVRSLG